MPPVTNKTTDAGLAQETRIFYDRVLTKRMLPNIIWPLFGQMKPMPTQSGKTINFRKFESLPVATTPLTEGVTPDGRALDMSDFSAVPKQYGDFIKITDVVDLVSPDPILTEANELLGEQAAETYDILVRDEIGAGTSVQFCGTGNTQTSEVAATDKITLDEIMKAVRTFHTNKVKKITAMLSASDGVKTSPIPASYIGIISAKTLYDLKSLSAGWVPVHQYSSHVALLPNEVGSVDEVRFILSDNPLVKAGAGTTAADIHCTILLGRDAYGIVNLAGLQSITKGFGSGDDPLNQRATTGWKAYFTAVRLNELCILRLEHGVSA